ncbi:MAG: hypothetical protein SO072_02640 [Dysosmobacter sp.]|nr:hypothetical protein [Dysosmobacter sp.]
MSRKSKRKALSTPLSHNSPEMEPENLHVYDALRAEIIQTEEKKNNYTTYMYTVFFAAFALAFQSSHILFPVSIAVLIIFQSRINMSTWLRHKVAAYIYVFFEKERNDIHWEHMNFDSNSQAYKHEDYVLHHTKSILISDHAAAILGGVALVADLSYSLPVLGNELTSPDLCLSSFLFLAEPVLTILLAWFLARITLQIDHSEEEKENLLKTMEAFREELFAETVHDPSSHPLQH